MPKNMEATKTIRVESPIPIHDKVDDYKSWEHTTNHKKFKKIGDAALALIEKGLEAWEHEKRLTQTVES